MPSYTCDSRRTLTCLFRTTLTLKWHGKKLNETSWSVGFGNADITKHLILHGGKKLHETNRSAEFWNADITKHLILKWHGEEKKRKEKKNCTKRTDRLGFETLTLRNKNKNVATRCDQILNENTSVDEKPNTDSNPVCFYWHSVSGKKHTPVRHYQRKITPLVLKQKINPVLRRILGFPISMADWMLAVNAVNI